jgi:hypothetical protein
MQKFNMIQAYAELPEGTKALFSHPEGQADQSRLIKMRINAPNACNLYITAEETGDEDGVLSEGETRFLAHVAAGHEQLEFYYKGSFILETVGGSIWLDTYDNTAFSVEASDFTNYARLWEREERDPRILEIERMARHNQENLMRQMKADREAYAAQFAAMAEKVTNNVAPSPAPASGGTPSPEQQVPSGAPASDPASDAKAEAGTGGKPDAEA